MLLHFISNTKPLFQTLSKALDMSRKTALTSLGGLETTRSHDIYTGAD